MAWKDFVGTLAIIIVFGILITLIVLVVSAFWARYAPCKSSANCPVGQTCDAASQRCKALPGSSCSSDSQCSIYAPLCQPQGRYCTNIPSQDRGTAGNPPRTGRGAPCDASLILNDVVNLCQQMSIGASCTLDAECNQGLCDRDTKTCRYATTHCNTDTNLNPTQCAPPYECNAQSLACTIAGATPGGDGTPCTSNADCAPGNTCILPPAGSGAPGVCHSGLATWLLLLGEVPGEDRCMPPLLGGDTGWCRYDIDTFMQCSTSLQCQYPYSVCLGDGLCHANTADPIDPTKFPYYPLAVNAPSVGVTGAFYTASFPLPQPPAENPTGGKLIDQYLDFIGIGQQFQNLPLYMGREIVTFSRYTSFIIASMAAASSDPNFPHPPQIPYHTAIFSDPDPVIVTASIIPNLKDPSRASLYFSIYSPASQLTLQQVGVDGTFGYVDSRIWNPWAVSQANSQVSVPAFISNPIITPWIDITVGAFAPPPQSLMIHSLIYADGHYLLGFYAYLRSNQAPVTASALLIPTLNGIPVTPDDLLITSWDAITTWYQRALPINTTVVMYGLARSSQQYVMGVVQIGFISDINGVLSPQVTSGAINYIPMFLNPVPLNMQTPVTQCRLSRAAQVVEPLLTLSFFFIVPTGLQVSTFVVNSTDGSFNLDNFPCTGSQILKNVASLLAVTPVTGAYNYGAFVVWCTTAQTRSAFLVVQVNALCFSPSSKSIPGLLYSAVYWRRLTGDPPDNYWLYPVGGASLPYFLAMAAPLTFDGDPHLLPI